MRALAPLPTGPPDAVVLFGGEDLAEWRHWDPGAEPRAIELDRRADTGAGGPAYGFPRWRVHEGTLVARPGFGDLLTRRSFGDYHLHLEFLTSPEPDWVPDGFRGASGVYLSGRYEIDLAARGRGEPGPWSAGAVAGAVPPLRDAARSAGSWQTLDVAYEHRAGGPAHVSVWLNDVRVQDGVAVEAATPYGFLAPLGGAEPDDARPRFTAGPEAGARCDWGAEAFAVSAEFRTEEGGTLLSKCPPAGEWAPDAKALFLRGGRIVYDIGWVGFVDSERRWNDGEWHRVVLTSDGGLARLYVDGELEGEREEFGAPDDEGFVLKVGAANHDFAGTYAGELGAVCFYDRGLSAEQAAALSAGGEAPLEPAFAWKPDPDAPPPAAPGDVLEGPIRLQADSSEVRFANVWLRPLGEVDHAGLIEGWGPASLERGRETWMGLCVSCHGSDGEKLPNPKARAFARAPLENGSDPLSLFRTVRDGFGEMPSNAWLSPRRTYDVVHYLREEFLRERNPSQYFPVTGHYLNRLPKGRRHGAPEEDRPEPRDYGPALGAQLGPEVGAGLAVRLDDETTLGYDLQTMESPGAWTGGFLQLAGTHHYQQRGEGVSSPDGRMLEGLDGWGWGHGGTLDWDRSSRPPRGPLPPELLDYHGYWRHGRSLVLSYAVDGREVLEQPGVDRSAGIPVITHRIKVAPGEVELVLCVARAPGDPAALLAYRNSEGPLAESNVLHSLVAVGPPGEEGPEPFAAAATLGGGRLRIDGARRITLRVPPSDEPTELFVLRTASPWGDELEAFRLYLENRAARPLPPPPSALTGGGPSQWPEDLVTAGELGDGGGPYVLDTLSLPEENPWNAWLRTSALDFLDDGRAAVATYGGDVWIVSGIDEELAELRWRRFAAGLFEPMGLRVVDGVVHVTCRDRIVRLEDVDGDGEADFYRSLFPDPDVTASFHAFSFDLQTDAQGNLYYAKSGQYTDYALPGAILKVAPDGSSSEVYCTGLRTPNGMGMSPGGRPLVSDNQGNWVPASKVSLTGPGGFYGVFASVNTSGAGIADRDDFDPPAVWMPQSFDSSSGGQLWVGDPRFGPLAGRYLHTSFGKGWMYPLVIHEVEGVPQGAVWRFPFQFAAGVQRARVNPADGQVYAVGLSGWQGPAGGADGCLQRVRYTGAAAPLLLDARATRGGVALRFSEPLDEAAVLDSDRYRVRRWNYRWARSYGSAHWSVERPDREGEDELRVVAAAVAGDGRGVELELDPWGPADQVELRFELESADGRSVEELVYLTVNRLP